MKICYVMKSGIYDHGVLYIGSEAACRDEARRFSQTDDGYHSYDVRQHAPPINRNGEYFDRAIVLASYCKNKEELGIQ